MGVKMKISELKKTNVWELNKHQFELPKQKSKDRPKGRIVTKYYKKADEHKDWIALNLFLWAQENGKQLWEEYYFDDERRWRSDYALPEMRILIEYEGLMSEKSRHTTLKGYTGDTDKYNAAQGGGWVVLRFTVINYKTMLTALNKHIKR